MKKSRKTAMEYWNKNTPDEGGYEPLMGMDNAPKLLPDQDIVEIPDDRPRPNLESLFWGNENAIKFEASREDRVARLARRLVGLG